MSTLSINSGDNYHLKKSGNTIEIEFSNGNTLYRQLVENGVPKEKAVVDYCEERISLYDGKLLKRVRDILTIVE